MGNTRQTRTAGMEKGLIEEGFKRIMSGIEPYRKDDDVSAAAKGCLAFVRGLRFSALLTYEMRQILNGTGLNVHWGAVMSKLGGVLSRECDIIVHTNGNCGRWDGSGGREPVMDFQFIKQQDVRLVISCKGYRLTRVDSNMQDYARDLRKYVAEVWLFAECCPEGRKRELARAAKKGGYSRFWHLYEPNDRWNLPGWHEFVSILRELPGRARGKHTRHGTVRESQ